MNKSFILKIILILIVVSIIMIGAGYWWWQNHNHKLITNSITPTTTSQGILNENQAQEGGYTDSQKIKDIENFQILLGKYYLDKRYLYPEAKSYSQMLDILSTAVDVSPLSTFALNTNKKDFIYRSGYILGVKLSDANNSILANSIHGKIEGMDCNPPIYCVRGEPEKQFRDARRVYDLKGLAMSLNSSWPVNSKEYKGSGSGYLCKNGVVYRSIDRGTAVDGTGWIPVDFSKKPDPPSKLPIDPINNENYYYSFSCDPQKQWDYQWPYEIDAKMESWVDDKIFSATDYGDDPDIYEVGTNPKLIH